MHKHAVITLLAASLGAATSQSLASHGRGLYFPIMGDDNGDGHVSREEVDKVMPSMVPVSVLFCSGDQHEAGTLLPPPSPA
jgi:hypothetical protein